MYYLIEISTYNNGTPNAYAVYAQETLDAATAAFHQKMAGAIRNETYASEMCLVIDAYGATQRVETWVRAVAPVVEE